jgi:hypothetical protein
VKLNLLWLFPITQILTKHQIGQLCSKLHGNWTSAVTGGIVYDSPKVFTQFGVDNIDKEHSVWGRVEWKSSIARKHMWVDKRLGG